MATSTPRQRAEQLLRATDTVLGRIDKEIFLSYEDEAYVATHAQAHATKAIACALLDIADAIRGLDRQEAP